MSVSNWMSPSVNMPRFLRNGLVSGVSVAWSIVALGSVRTIDLSARRLIDQVVNQLRSNHATISAVAIISNESSKRKSCSALSRKLSGSKSLNACFPLTTFCNVIVAVSSLLTHCSCITIVVLVVSISFCIFFAV